MKTVAIKVIENVNSGKNVGQFLKKKSFFINFIIQNIKLVKLCSIYIHKKCKDYLTN